MTKKKFTARLLSAAMALALCLGLSTTTFAATGDNVTEAAITKNLQMDTNVTTPEVTFTFKVEKVSLDGSEEEAEKAKMPTIENPTIEFTGDDEGTTDTATGLKEVKKQTANIIPAVTDFPHAGVYKYKVTEEPSGYTEAEGTTMAYSQAEFSLEIYVKNGTDGLEIAGVRVDYTKGDDGTAKTEKVDPTPGTGGGVSAWEFVNQFTKNGGTDDPYDPDNPDDRHKDGALEIAKAVTGDMGDKTKQFTFALTLTKLSALEAEGTTYTGTIHRADGTTTEKVISTSEVSFTLADGEYLTFAYLPVGTVYTISETEKDQDGYTTSVKTLSDGQASTMEENVVVGERANFVGYTNNKEGTVPTGIIVNNLPFIILIFVAVCGFAGYIVFRRRKYTN